MLPSTPTLCTYILYRATVLPWPERTSASADAADPAHYSRDGARHDDCLLFIYSSVANTQHNNHLTAHA
eukprot:scaffold11130_cov136-Isochrysis_galbana.AAC.3